MAYFLRQYHVMTSLKTGKEKDVLPLYKALVPVLSLHPAVQSLLHTRSLGKNLQLNTSGEDPPKCAEEESSRRPLAVLLSWMLAKENHLDKYRSLYLSKGFDVLTVRLTPKDLLFPVSGSQAVASDLLDYLLQTRHRYQEILMHAFSVGGYMMGEMFVKMRDEELKYRDVAPRIRGVVLDSAVDFEGIPAGFPRAVSRNPLTLRVLEWYVATHLALMYHAATKHYLRSSKNFHDTPLRCPALLFASEADRVGSPGQNRLVARSWQVRGVDVRFRCFKDSKHVAHMLKYPEEYAAEIDDFLNKIDLLKPRSVQSQG